MSKKVLAFSLTMLLVGVIATSAFAQKKVEILIGVWRAAERDAFMKMVEPFERVTGTKVILTGAPDFPALLATRVKGGNPPEIALSYSPGLVRELVKENALVELKTFMDIDKIKDNYPMAWIDLGTYEGGLYGFYLHGSVKSIVYYVPKAFAAAGYEIPKTWDELMTLSDKIVAGGKTPWCIALEEGKASGWPGSDWIEDIMLRIAGPKVYDKWIKHEISWTDPRVKRAWELFGRIARSEKYTYGGPTNELTVNTADGPDALFTSPPKAYMHKQGSFAKSWIFIHHPNLVAGVDFDFFPFPLIETRYGNPIMVAGDQLIMFKESKNISGAKALMRYLTTSGAQTIWVTETGRLSPNRRVNIKAYPDDFSRKCAQIMINAKTIRFDGGDQMPSAVGFMTFLPGIVDYVRGMDLDTILKRIEKTAVEVYGK